MDREAERTVLFICSVSRILLLVLSLDSPSQTTAGERRLIEWGQSHRPFPSCFFLSSCTLNPDQHPTDSHSADSFPCRHRIHSIQTFLIDQIIIIVVSLLLLPLQSLSVLSLDQGWGSELCHLSMATFSSSSSNQCSLRVQRFPLWTLQSSLSSKFLDGFILRFNRFSIPIVSSFDCSSLSYYVLFSW